MKAKFFLSAAVAVIVAASCSTGSGAQKAVKLDKPLVDSTSYLIGINLGSWIKNYQFADNLNELNMNLVIKGMQDFIAAKGDQRDSNFVKQFKINPESMNQVLGSYLDKRGEAKKALNKEAGEKFLAANLKNKGVQETESGLQYIIIEAGEEPKVGPSDTVSVNYKGTTIDGEVFDQSHGAPVTFPLSNVIPGWIEGLQLVGKGGKIQLFVPSELAYGERGAGGSIGPNSVLQFEVEVVDVKPFAAKAEEQDEVL